MTAAKIGWGGEFWFESAANVLTELSEVVSFTLPNGETEQIDATHLKSPNRRREFISGMIDDGDLTVVLNYVPGSATDLLIMAALTDGAIRDYKAVIPRATANWLVTGTAFASGVDRGEVTPDGKMEVTVTLRVSGSATEAAAT